MRNFIIGALVGIAIAATTTTWAAGGFGVGYMNGWVVEMNGGEVCSDPYMNAAIKVIECD